MSIIYKTNLNETLFIPKISEKVSIKSRSSSTYNYEVLLPIVFVIVFIIILFLIYAYNNLNLKQFFIDHLRRCVLTRQNDRNRRRFAQYDRYPRSNQPSEHTNQFSHSKENHKTLGSNKNTLNQKSQYLGLNFN